MYKEKLKTLFKSPALADIFHWAKSAYGSIFLICLFSLISSGSSLVITLSTRGLIDGATAHDAGQVLRYAVIMVLTVVVIRMSAIARSLVNMKTNAVLLRDMRTAVLHKLLKKQYAGLDGYHSGELVNRMFSDVSIVQSGIMSIAPHVVSMVVSFVGAAVILISMDWRFVVLLIFGGLLGLGLIIGFKKPMKERHKAVQEREGKLHALMQETLENMHLIKASCSEKRMEHQADACQQSFLDAQLRRGRFSTGMNATIGTVFHLSWLFCMLWGCRSIYRGVLTYGSLAAVIQLIGQIQSPIASAADIAAQAYSTVSSAERLKELLDLPEEPETEAVSGQALYAGLKSITFRDVNFDYDREPVLKNVNAVIEPGDFVALTGVSGGGKSTLFQLLLGIYVPKSGAVEFDFANGVQTASKATRPLFAYVPQGNNLFSGTLRENIAMFTDDASDDDIRKAAEIACIGGLIDTLDDGLDTVLGERGIGLSEGQAQRIAVARAILSGAPVLLLDESTSALDEETEAQLLKNISGMEDKTCIIVTHRRAALSICDYCLHIDSGTATRIDL